MALRPSSRRAPIGSSGSISIGKLNPDTMTSSIGFRAVEQAERNVGVVALRVPDVAHEPSV